MKTKILLTAILMVSTINLFCQIINVPNDQPTIQAGINVATNGDTVLVGQGIYYENINFTGKAITVSSHYLIENDSSHIYNTIINGSQPNPTDSACVVLFNSNEDTASVLNGFTITGGSGCFWPDNPLFQNMKGGGGIQIISCGAKITHNIVTDNHVTNTFEAFGGGIQGADLPEDKMIIIEDNLVCDNTVAGNLWVKGGGIVVAFCHTRICNNIVKNNTVTGNNITVYTAAGGIWYSTGTSYVCDVLIEGNEVFDNELISISSSSSGTWGGGIVVYGQGSNIDPIINKNLIYNNKIIAPDHTYGNGIIINSCNSAEFKENIVYGNTHDSPVSCGGGLCVWNSHPVVSRNLIYNNLATQGGGIYVGYQITSQPQFFNNTIYGNDVTGPGGGLYLKNSSAIVKNIIIWGNTALASPGIWIEAGVNNTIEYSDVQGWTGSTTNIDKDPLFEDPENFDFHITWCHCPVQDTTMSPCIDAGDPDSPPNLDGTICDMGAYYFDQREILAFDATDITGTSFTANWQAAEDATGYLLDVAHDENFSDFVYQNQDVGNVVSFSIENLNPLSVYYYRVRAKYYFGRSGYSNAIIVATLTSINDRESLSNIISVYPNPFSNQTTIEFTLPESELVTLSISDITGKRPETILSKKLQIGNHKINWNAEDLNEGVYFIRLETNYQTITKKVILIE